MLKTLPDSLPGLLMQRDALSGLMTPDVRGLTLDLVEGAYCL